MAAEGGEKAQNNIDMVHQQMTDAGQFSFGAVCALSLRELFDDEWNREFNKEALSVILNGLEQPKQVQESIQALYQGQGQDNRDPFVDQILTEEVLNGDASPIIKELIGFAVSQGKYDARLRVMIRHLTWQLRVDLDTMEDLECDLAQTILHQKYEKSEEETAEQQKKVKRSKMKRAALIGLATVTGGTLIGLTGGLAAPLVAAGAGAIIGGAGAAALGSVAGVAIIGSLFGVAGAGLTGYKMKRRMGAIEEFQFEPLVSEGPLRMKAIRDQLHVVITVTGWLDSNMQDFKLPWCHLVESQEQYTLRWESKYLLALGRALDYVFNSAVSVATSEALKYTVLSTIIAAIAWPAALLSVSHMIDNPWGVALQRAVAAGRELTEVLLSREQGNRPVTLIGYSLGGRVIYYCLQEMAKRKGCEGIVENAIILGAPVTGDPKSWAALQRVVSGKIINGYCRGDWLLKFLYRTSSARLKIAGLGPIMWTNRRMHNIDLSSVVSGHLDYKEQLDTVLSAVGLRVRQDVQAAEQIINSKPSSTNILTGGKSSPSSSSVPGDPSTAECETARNRSDDGKDTSETEDERSADALSSCQTEEEVGSEQLPTTSYHLHLHLTTTTTTPNTDSTTRNTTANIDNASSDPSLGGKSEAAGRSERKDTASTTEECLSDKLKKMSSGGAAQCTEHRSYSHRQPGEGDMAEKSKAPNQAIKEGGADNSAEGGRKERDDGKGERLVGKTEAEQEDEKDSLDNSDSGEEDRVSFTSSNPGSSSEEETTPSQNYIV